MTKNIEHFFQQVAHYSEKFYTCDFDSKVKSNSLRGEAIITYHYLSRSKVWFHVIVYPNDEILYHTP